MHLKGFSIVLVVSVFLESFNYQMEKGVISSDRTQVHILCCVYVYQP